VLSLELNTPKTFACECCGGTTTTLTRYVYKDGDAFAVYFARFPSNHADQSIAVLVSIGGWGTGDPAKRVSTALEMRVLESGPAVMVIDAATSPWEEDPVLGRMLDRSTALAHPAIRDVFAIIDCMVVEDPPLRAYIESVASS